MNAIVAPNRLILSDPSTARLWVDRDRTVRMMSSDAPDALRASEAFDITNAGRLAPLTDAAKADLATCLKWIGTPYQQQEALAIWLTAVRRIMFSALPIIDQARDVIDLIQLTIRCLDETPHLRGRDLVALFDLTQAEASLAIDLFRGGTVSDVAARRGVAVSTIRTQLRAILRKTDMKRQADLISLLHRLSAR